MKRDARFALILLAATVLALLAAVLRTDAQSAPAPCPAKFNVAVISGASLNIRAEAGGTSKVIGTLTEKDSVQRIVESVTMDGRNFFRLESGGWIIGRYLIIVCDPETPTPTATMTPTVTATPQPTPTQIRHNFIWCRHEPKVNQSGGLWFVQCESP